MRKKWDNDRDEDNCKMSVQRLDIATTVSLKMSVEIFVRIQILNSRQHIKYFQGTQ